MVKLLLLSLQVLKTMRKSYMPVHMYQLKPHLLICFFNIMLTVFHKWKGRKSSLGKYQKCSFWSQSAGGVCRRLIDSSWQAESRQGSVSQSKQTCAVAYTPRADSVLLAVYKRTTAATDGSYLQKGFYAVECAAADQLISDLACKR